MATSDIYSPGVTRHAHLRAAKILKPNAAVYRPLDDGSVLSFDRVLDALGHPTTKGVQS